MLVAGLAGLAVAALAGIAIAKTFTLKVAKNVHVTNAAFAMFRVKAVNAHESIAVGPAGFAVYTFQGETKNHIICKKTASAATNCWGFWPPVTPKSAKGLSAQAGIKGTLGTFKNHGTLQLTLNNQPLYYFKPDLTSHNNSAAAGDELKTFGSIWHVVAVSSSSHGTKSTGTTTTTTTTSPYPTTPTPTTTTPYPTY
jgi:predicted lipoprotein with Yx(FWY)xxD motif